uniref:Uncharacterized protein n=1 Tax=Anguilla anguilla TaxID=7936 RepID=A0A0E9QBY4_ANGAN
MLRYAVQLENMVSVWAFDVLGCDTWCIFLETSFLKFC